MNFIIENWQNILTYFSYSWLIAGIIAWVTLCISEYYKKYSITIGEIIGYFVLFTLLGWGSFYIAFFTNAGIINIWKIEIKRKDK